MATTNLKIASALSRRDYLRRAALLCINCVRNVAFYRAAHAVIKTRSLQDRTPLHRAIHNNFLDIAVLEWCKLFGNKEPHSWNQLVTDKKRFHIGLLAHLKCTKRDFHDYRQSILQYRADFVAHLLEKSLMEIPYLDRMLHSTIYYYEYLLAHEAQGAYQPNLSGDIRKCHQESLAEAEEFYKRTLP